MWWKVKGGVQGQGSVRLHGFLSMSFAVLMYGITVLSTNAPKPVGVERRTKENKK